MHDHCILPLGHCSRSIVNRRGKGERVRGGGGKLRGSAGGTARRFKTLMLHRAINERTFGKYFDLVTLQTEHHISDNISYILIARTVGCSWINLQKNLCLPPSASKNQISNTEIHQQPPDTHLNINGDHSRVEKSSRFRFSNLLSRVIIVVFHQL